MKSKIYDPSKSEQAKQFQKKINKNMSKKVLFFTILLLLFNFSIQAQDNEAKDLLNKVTTIIKGYDNITIDFK